MAAYYAHIIGSPFSDARWHELLYRGMMTAGFDGLPGDDGESKLKTPAEGDWVIAWASGSGYVGAGRAKGSITYKLHPRRVPGSLSNHQHERGVDWILALPSVSQAVWEDVAGRLHPRQTIERVTGEGQGEQMLEALRRAGAQDLSKGLRVSGPDNFWLTADAALTLYARTGEPASTEEIRNYIKSDLPDYKVSNVLSDLCLMSVNDRNRGHYSRKREGLMLRSDQGHPHDLLYKVGYSHDGLPRYKPYSVEEHGVWELQPDYKGAPHLLAPGRRVTLVSAAVEAAQEEADANPRPPLGTEQEAREWEMRAVALRRGQAEFRAKLLDAYDRRCAITDCAVVDILEAAHIVPFREGGESSNRVDNGLLLRSDLHALFDLGLVWIDPRGLVQVAEKLYASEYVSLRGRRLRVPTQAAEHPHGDHLTRHRVNTARQST
jgi:hypothetical protein